MTVGREKMRGPARINVKVVVILVLATGLLGAGAVVGHYVRKKVTANRWLAEGKAALAKEDWAEACKYLKRYLSKYPDDEDMLVKYAEANLAVRPTAPKHVGAAIGAYRRLLRRHRPDDASICRQLAKLYYTFRHYGEAAYFCRQRLESDPSDAWAQLWLGKSLVAQRKSDEATTVLQQLVQERPGRVVAYVLLSDLALGNGGRSAMDEALAWLDLCVERNPESAEARALRARFHRTVRNDGTAARADLTAAEQRQPIGPDTRVLLAGEWMHWGDLERARRNLACVEHVTAEDLRSSEIDVDAFSSARLSAAGKLALLSHQKEQGAELADRALEELAGTPYRIAFLPTAFDLYLADGRLAAARRVVDEYRIAIEKGGQPEPAARDQLALFDAVLAQSEGRFYSVIEELEELVIRRPQAPQAWRLLSQAYEKTGQTRRAIDALEQYIARGGQDPSALTTLARAYRQHDWRKAFRYAEQAESVRPGDLSATLVRIEANLRGGAGTLRESQTADLAAELAALRESNPHDVNIRLLQASLALSREDTEGAAEILRQAISECDDPLPAELHLSRLQSWSGHTDVAIEVCQSAIQRHPDLARPRIALAELQYACSRPEDARDTLGQAVSSLAGDEKLRATRALAAYLLSAGERSSGIELLKRLAQEQPEDMQTRLALLELGEVQNNRHEAQKLVDEIRKIEGERGLNWRFEQAKLWLRAEEWTARQQQLTDMLSQCIRADPAWAEPVVALGVMYENLGRDDKAEETYRRATRIHPVPVTVTNQLLNLLERQGRFSEADKLLTQLPEDAPVSAGHRVNIALGLGDYPSAIEKLQQRIAADPTDAHSRVMLARLVYAHGNDVAYALTLLDEAQALAPDLLAVASSKASILHAERRDDEAVALIDAEVERRRDFESYQLRAAYYAAVGQLDAAEKDYTRLTTFTDAAAEGYAALGKFYHRIDKIDAAIAAWDEGLEVDPDNVGLKRLLVALLVTSQQPEARERGRQLLEGLLDQLPDDPDLLLVRATLLLDERTPQKNEEAAAILEQVVDKDLRNVAAHQRLIRLAKERGDLNKAAELISRALGANPKSPELILEQALLEADRNNLQVAWELTRSVVESDPPKRLTVLNPMSELALRTGATDFAEELNNEALAIDPTNERAQVLRASILSWKGQQEEAVRNLESYRQTEQGRRSVNALLALAEVYRAQRRFDTAEARLKEAERLAPRHLPLFLERLRWFAAQGRFKEILPQLAEHGTDYPSQPHVLAVGAWLLTSAGTDECLRQARTLFDRLVAMEPHSSDGYLGLGQVAYRLGEVDAAVTAYRRTLELDPYHRQALNDLAWILGVDLGKPQEALQIAEKGAARYPDDPHLLDTRGVLMEMLDRLADARRDLERCAQVAREVPPTLAQALFHLGRVCMKQGELATAGQRLTEALALDRRHSVFTREERAEIERLVRSVSQQAKASGALEGALVPE